MGEKERGLEGAFLMVQIFARAFKSPLSWKIDIKISKQKTQEKVHMLAKKCIKIYDLVLANDRKNIILQVLKLKG